MKIIAFTGMPFSGKSEAVEIAKQHGLSVIRMGDLVWDEVRSQGLPLSDETVGTVANEMRDKHGKDYWAIKTVEKIKLLQNSSVVIIDGIRNEEEINRFRIDLEGSFLLIAIDVSSKTRYRRAMTRGRIDDTCDINKIIKRDKREEEWGIKDVISKADIYISNEGDLESFRKEMNRVISQELSVV